MAIIKNIIPDTCYVFDNVVLRKIPKCARQKFINICYEYSVLHKESRPTLKSLAYALFVLTKDKAEIMNKYEKMAFQVANRTRFYTKLLDEALEEYQSCGMPTLYAQYKYSGEIHFRRPLLMSQMILADHILRHREKVPMLKKLSKLRCATRKELKLEKNAWVGF